MNINKNAFGVNVGDRIYARRPVYNCSDEIIPVEKKIRPFIVLAVYDEKLLVVNVTSNGNNRHNIEVAPWSYARTNDLYLINITDVDNVKEKIADNTFKELIFRIYNVISTNDEVLYNDEVKSAFLEAYDFKIRKEFYQKLAKTNKVFDKGDVIYLWNNPNRKYIIDKISEDGYLGYIIAFNNDDLIIDFSHQILLPKDEFYYFYSSISLERYDELMNLYTKQKYSKDNSDPQFQQKKFRCGDIVSYNGKEYFVIFKGHENKLVCIPYNGNYLLDRVYHLDLKDCLICNIRLNNREKVSILKKLSSNIKIYHDDYLQNQISVKIKKYNKFNN